MLQDFPPAPVSDTACKFCIALAVLWPAAFANAQTSPQAAAPAASAAVLTPAERAQRDGDKVFHWILIHSDKPRKGAAVKDEKPVPVAARVKPPVRVTRAEAPASEASAPGENVAEAKAAKAPEAVPESVTVAASAAAASPVAVVAEDPVETLTLLSRAEPRFPPSLLRTLSSGRVQVKFTVLPDGSVAGPEVVASSNSRLNSSALTAVAQWRFAPLHKPRQGIVDLGFDNAE